jgi:uncharacterized membrane protein required for colicin V production
MNGLDIFSLVMLGIFGILGVKQGLVQGLFQIASWLVSIFVAWLYSAEAANWFMANFVGLDPMLAKGLGVICAFLVPFLVLSLGGGLVNKLVKSLAPLRLANRMGGLALGVLKGALLCALVCAVLDALPVQGDLKAFRDGSEAYSFYLSLHAKLT